MQTPIPEYISQAIVSRLEGILVDEDYSFDVSEVVRPTRRGENWQRKHLGIGVLQGEFERVPELDCPGNPPAVCYAMNVNLECVCRNSKAETDAKTVNEYMMASDAVQAITNHQNWHTFGGYAINAELGSPSPFSSPEGELNGMEIPLRILYRVSENNPYEVRA